MGYDYIRNCGTAELAWALGLYVFRSRMGLLLSWSCPSRQRLRCNLPSSRSSRRGWYSSKGCNIIELGAPSYPFLFFFFPKLWDPYKRATYYNCATRCWNGDRLSGPRWFTLGFLSSLPRRVLHTIHGPSIFNCCCEPSLFIRPFEMHTSYRASVNCAKTF